MCRRAISVVAAGVAVVLGVGAQAAWAVGDAGLVGQWRFDELGGQEAVDDGPHRLHGGLGGTNAPGADDPVRIEGAFGRALRFTGATFVRLPDSDALALQALTAEAVVQASSSPGQWRYLISRGSQGCTAGAYGLYTGAAGGLAFYVFDGTRYIVSATARPDDVWNGAWHHVAGSFDGRALRLFVDGRPVGDPMDAPLRIDYFSTSTHAAIGQYTGTCELSFRGDIDLVRLWSGARSRDEVTAAARELAPQNSGATGALPPAAAGTVLPADGARSPARPGRGCAVRLVRRVTTRTRRISVRVRATVGRRPLRGARLIARKRGRRRPLRGARLIARERGRRRLLATARTDANGEARLLLSRSRARHVRISAQHRPKCLSLSLRLRRM